VDTSIKNKTVTPDNTNKHFSERLLLEQGIEYVRQERYSEGMAILKMVNEYLTLDLLPFSTLLTTLLQEYTKYSQLQQTLQDVSAQFVEIHAELKASVATFNTLSSQFLDEKNMELTPTLYIAEQVDYTSEQASHENKDINLAFHAICLSSFAVKYQGVPLILCPNRNAQTILRYLITRPDHSATVDTLMTLLWPDDIEKVAIRKLNVTISILRRCLQTQSGLQDKYILCKNGVYQFNPSIQLHSDVEDFLLLYNTGRKLPSEAAISYYELACSLYTRPFLLEDLYSDWSSTRREQLRQIHLNMCRTLSLHFLEKRAYEIAAQWARMIIEENRCDESAYCLLMRIYAIEGRRNEALKQFQLCKQALLEDLNLRPMPETVALCQAIIHGDFQQ
jgi:DNA-binding SARP family transcriptional activator